MFKFSYIILINNIIIQIFTNKSIKNKRMLMLK